MEAVLHLILVIATVCTKALNANTQFVSEKLTPLLVLDLEVLVHHQIYALVVTVTLVEYASIFCVSVRTILMKPYAAL